MAGHPKQPKHEAKQSDANKKIKTVDLIEALDSAMPCAALPDWVQDDYYSDTGITVHLLECPQIWQAPGINPRKDSAESCIREESDWRSHVPASFLRWDLPLVLFSSGRTLGLDPFEVTAMAVGWVLSPDAPIGEACAPLQARPLDRQSVAPCDV